MFRPKTWESSPAEEVPSSANFDAVNSDWNFLHNIYLGSDPTISRAVCDHPIDWINYLEKRLDSTSDPSLHFPPANSDTIRQPRTDRNGNPPIAIINEQVVFTRLLMDTLNKLYNEDLNRGGCGDPTYHRFNKCPDYMCDYPSPYKPIQVNKSGERPSSTNQCLCFPETSVGTGIYRLSYGEYLSRVQNSAFRTNIDKPKFAHRRGL